MVHKIFDCVYEFRGVVIIAIELDVLLRTYGYHLGPKYYEDLLNKSLKKLFHAEYMNEDFK